MSTYTKIFLVCLSVGLTSIKPCLAQSNILPDDTLGTEASQIVPNVNNLDGIPSTLIEGGAERGENLFHSFEEFNISQGQGAYFLVPNNAIQNVLTRVTGNNPSEINGILGTISNRNFDPTSANLFLINPNGMIFGRNASLDVDGSFVGTTANAVGFGEQGFFSATNPQAPPGLLTISPTAFLFNQINAQASIQNNSIADVDLYPIDDDSTFRGLRVPDGKSLLLLGGNVTMDGGDINRGGLIALGGRVELGGLAGEGTVGLEVDGNNLSLNFPDGVERSDVTLSNKAGVSVPIVSGGNGGSIAVNARNLSMTENSSLVGGIARGSGSEQSRAGNINVNATGVIKLNNESEIRNNPLQDSRGEGGNINISASTLLFENGGRVDSATFSEVKAGNITVDAQDIQLIGKSGGEDPQESGLFTFTESIGNAGNLMVKTNTLAVVNGAQMAAFTDGEGDGGNVTVYAEDVQLRNGAQLSSSTAGEGNAGNITINASDTVIVKGPLDDEQGITLINSDVLEGSTGNGGDIAIAARSIILDNRALVAASIFEGQGKDDNPSIAGNVNFEASEKIIVNGSSILSEVRPESFGNGGNIKIKAPEVILKNRLRRPDLGDVFGSLVTQMQKGARGDKAGDIEIEADKLLITNTSINALSGGSANGGSIKIKASEITLENGSELITQVGEQAEGDADNIEIEADQLLITNSNINAKSAGIGEAGQININLNNNFLADNGQVLTQSEQSSGGEISISAKNIILRNNSDIRATLQFTKGRGGDIDLSANAIIALEDSDILAFAPFGTGGEITFDTRAFLSDPLYSSTAQTTDVTTLNKLDGNNRVDVNASGRTQPGTVSVDDNSSFLQDSLTELAQNLIDSQALIASSCVVRSKKRNGSFFITGSGGFPYHPGDGVPSVYSAVEVLGVDDSSVSKARGPWKIGDPIVEPTGVYRLGNGRRILSRECGS